MPRACNACRTEEDRDDAVYCRRCGVRLPFEAPPSGVSKTEPDPPPPEAKPAAPSPAQALTAVRRLVELPVGHPWYVEIPLVVARAALVFVVVTTAAAMLGFLRHAVVGSLGKASAEAATTVLDVAFGTLFFAVTALLTHGLLRLTGRGWRRPRWGRA